MVTGVLVAARKHQLFNNLDVLDARVTSMIVRSCAGLRKGVCMLLFQARLAAQSHPRGLGFDEGQCR